MCRVNCSARLILGKDRMLSLEQLEATDHTNLPYGAGWVSLFRSKHLEAAKPLRLAGILWSCATNQKLPRQVVRVITVEPIDGGKPAVLLFNGGGSSPRLPPSDSGTTCLKPRMGPLQSCRRPHKAAP